MTVLSYRAAIGELGRPGLRQALATGTLMQPARGWYATPNADPSVLSAVRIGGRLGCVSAARFHGLWTPPPNRLHVCLNRREPSHMPAPMTLVHQVRSWPDDSAVLPLLTALHQVTQLHDLETAIIVVESAIDKRHLSLADGRAIVAARHGGDIADRWVTDGAQSGTETRVRLWLQRRRVSVRPQVWIDGVGRVDLLVGESLVIELDSRAHHTGEDSYANDHERNLALAERGYRYVRLTYEQVFHEWAQTQIRLLRLIRTRRHRTTPLATPRRRPKSAQPRVGKIAAE